MKRIDTATRANDLFGAGKHGFKDGNLGLGILPTDFDASICNNLQEELANQVEGAGIVLDGNVRTQVTQAIKRLAGANVTVVTAAMSPFALTADHAGLVLVNAAAGNVVLNLPLANVVVGLPLPFSFGRIDVAANAVTINAAGANLVDGVASLALVGQWASRSIRSDAVSAWATLSQTNALGIDAGMVAYFARNTAPAGYLKANGALVSRAVYATLFAAIGTVFGAGDGATTFGLPDLRGEFLRGWDDGRGIDAGRAFGSAQVDDLRSHQHALRTRVLPDGTGQGLWNYAMLLTEAQTGTSTSLPASGTAATGAAETRPRNIAMLACIKF